MPHVEDTTTAVVLLARAPVTFAMKPRLSMSLLASRTLRLVRSPCRMFMLCKWAMPLAISLAVANTGVRSGRP